MQSTLARQPRSLFRESVFVRAIPDSHARVAPLHVFEAVPAHTR